MRQIKCATPATRLSRAQSNTFGTNSTSANGKMATHASVPAGHQE